METALAVLATVCSALLVGFGVLWRAYVKKDGALQACTEARQADLEAQLEAQLGEYQELKKEAKAALDDEQRHPED